MRINVYSQEITKEIALVTKTSENGVLHYGVRIFLASTDLLHYNQDDDDRSAITFWIPNCDSFTPTDLAEVFTKMSRLTTQIPE